MTIKRLISCFLCEKTQSLNAMWSRVFIWPLFFYFCCWTGGKQKWVTVFRHSCINEHSQHKAGRQNAQQIVTERLPMSCLEEELRKISGVIARLHGAVPPLFILLSTASFRLVIRREEFFRICVQRLLQDELFRWNVNHSTNLPNIRIVVFSSSRLTDYCTFFSLYCVLGGVNIFDLELFEMRKNITVSPNKHNKLKKN